ncbi:sigma-70 family RNA polymerase sigma factor [Viridibacterium curvum]|uniref:RNA polymerase sigma factor n=1 Tax=Viridibacterium curvum TaxID=1101404 RepID=A0ABP9Q6A0_9RHOO
MNAWHAHERELRGWLLHHGHDAALAEDLLQDVFLKAMRQGSQFCEIANARAWLFEVTRNALSDHFRRERASLPLPDDLPAEIEEIATVDSLASCLPRVLNELAPQDREALVRCDLEGMSQAEFARQQGISLPAAKSRVQRARSRLKAQLGSACQVAFDDQGLISGFVPRPPLASAPD